MQLNAQVTTQWQPGGQAWLVLLLTVNYSWLCPYPHTQRRPQLHRCQQSRFQLMHLGDCPHDHRYMIEPLFGLEGRPAHHRGHVAPATFPHRICVKWVPFVKLAVLAWKPCTFWAQNGVDFRPFRTTFSMIAAQIVVFILISPFPPF